MAEGDAIMNYYDAKNPTGEILKFKEMAAEILGCSVENAIPEMNALHAVKEPDRKIWLFD